MFSVHQQTIRMYEKEGLVSPKRSAGNTRLFSEDDVDRLEEIINLTHKMGVNLAGVEMVLKLQKKIKRLQGDMNKLFSQLDGNLEQEQQEYRQGAKKQAQRLIEMKKAIPKRVKRQEKHGLSPDIEIIEPEHEDESASQATIIDDWQIEYEDDEK